MLLDDLDSYEIILASKSPRRKFLLEEMGLKFRVFQSEDKESMDFFKTPSEIVMKLASQKAENAYNFLKNGVNEKPLLVIGGDTIVVADGKILGKPKDIKEAKIMLEILSGRTHSVLSALSVVTRTVSIRNFSSTKVSFGNITKEEIDYYINRYHPFDKAGSYGIQEWIGYVSIKGIEGSFYNVVGLPTHLLWKMLAETVYKNHI